MQKQNSQRHLRFQFGVECSEFHLSEIPDAAGVVPLYFTNWALGSEKKKKEEHLVA